MDSYRQGLPPHDTGTPGERIEKILEVAAADPGLREDLKKLVRLTADYLYLLGHRTPAGEEGHVSHPGKAYKVFKELDAHLGKMEKILGLDAPRAAESA